MILFFRTTSNDVYAVGTRQPLPPADIQKLIWLFDGALSVSTPTVKGTFLGPRKEMVSPWSTNAVEITQIMGIEGIERIEAYTSSNEDTDYDRMLLHRYQDLDQEIFSIHHSPEPVRYVDDISTYSAKEGLALSTEEINYLNQVSHDLGRKLTDSEIFGFSQVNSEHCRHKIFNGTFIIDGERKPFTLFQLIKETSKKNPNLLVSAYKDNVAFVEGPRIEQFAPVRQDKADFFSIRDIDSVISLKAETHNFPTTVEPFNGAATGSGGEIRDRLAGGKGSLPLAGTAVYMTSYSRLEKDRAWEVSAERKWLYHPPAEILIKASDGASDFGNKFGQPLICGSVLTFEHAEAGKTFGFDKVIMLAGGIGFANKKDAQKGHLKTGDKIMLLGGDNYRIGMGGGAVSSVATGEYALGIELNAVQRSNPEMQKRVMNAIRALVESEENPIITIHDHGAGGHLNCFSELLEETGGRIDLDALPVGDPTLSDKELISNESQERMGLGIAAADLETLEKISHRERAPVYAVGEATGDHALMYGRIGQNQPPFQLAVNHLFGSSPVTVLEDHTQKISYASVDYNPDDWRNYLEQVLQLEAVACKDWLTNKVDRSVGGKVATQQTCGPVQLPLNNVGVMALDFQRHRGVATAIGHAPAVSLIDPAAGGKLAIAEALTNLVWAPLSHGLKGVSLSANWMWPSKVEGEDARLYAAVEAVSAFAIALGINIPTGKDSLSMTQKYPDGKVVYAPGTVIISAVAEVEDIRKTISPALQPITGSHLLYIPFATETYALGGSCFAQVVNKLGGEVPHVEDAVYFARVFDAVQLLIKRELLLAGHDVSAGGMITALLEMCFPVPGIGLNVKRYDNGADPVQWIFNERPGVFVQTDQLDSVRQVLDKLDIRYTVAAEVTEQRFLDILGHSLPVDDLRDTWFRTSYLLDRRQRNAEHAERRYKNYGKQPLEFSFPPSFDGQYASLGIEPHRRTASGLKAAIIREKGVNGDREMAYSLYLAGFDVKDIHMTDLVSGREDLSDVNMIVFVGGFSNSDVLGSAKGWAGAFLYNARAKDALDRFYAREDTLTLGVCNGCQLMMELGLLYPTMKQHPRMRHNGSGKFESIFVNVTIPENNSVMMKALAGARLGVWVAHGEGRFVLPEDTGELSVVARYSYSEYPGNPNDSGMNVAALSSADGRHLAIMPHLERSLFPWNWPYYPHGREADEISPWMIAFRDSIKWIADRS